LKTLDTKALLVVVDGSVLLDYGDSRYVSKAASMRKSVLGMLYGKYVQSGKVDLQKTVVELGLQDTKPFLPIEENATLEMLLMSRSGIYQFDVEEGMNQPPRNGSQYPGSFFSYQNWDFDAAGTAFEKLTGRNIYDALETISRGHSPCRTSIGTNKRRVRRGFIANMPCTRMVKKPDLYEI
jgi:CubicO group peptidase (beta-lactamase class C family)